MSQKYDFHSQNNLQLPNEKASNKSLRSSRSLGLLDSKKMSPEDLNIRIQKDMNSIDNNNYSSKNINSNQNDSKKRIME
jgi:hypothetical protein